MEKGAVQYDTGASYADRQGLRIKGAIDYGVRRNLMWPIESRMCSEGFWITMHLRLNGDGTLPGKDGEMLLGLLDLVMFSQSKVYGNPTLLVLKRGNQRSLALLMRQQKSDNPRVLQNQTTGIIQVNTWHEVRVFVRIKDAVLTDSLVLDGKLVGCSEVKLIDVPGFLQCLYLCPTFTPDSSKSSVDLDNISILSAVQSDRENVPIVQRPVPCEFIRSVFPAFIAQSGQVGETVSFVQVRVASEGSVVADSMFVSTDSMIFPKPFMAGREYTSAMRYCFHSGTFSEWTRSVPFFISEESYEPRGKTKDDNLMLFGHLPGQAGIFHYGDTIVLNFSYKPQDSSHAYIDVNVRAMAVDPGTGERYGRFMPSGNFVFNLGSYSSLFFKTGQGPDQWAPFIREADTNVFPGSMVVYDQCIFSQGKGRAIFTFVVSKKMAQGMWVINACMVNDLEASVWEFPSLYFNLTSQPDSRRFTVLFFFICAMVLGAGVVLYRVIQKRRIAEVQPVWKKIADETEAYLRTNFSNPDLDNDLISNAMQLSTARLGTIYQQVRGKSPVQHLREIRIEKACELLTSTRLSVAEIGYSVGFTEPIIFQRNFKKMTRKTPSQFRGK